MFVAVFSLYLFAIQVFDARGFRDRTKHRTKKLFVLRGEIIDRNGLKLASDKTSYDLYAHTKYYDHTPEELAEFLAPILKTNKATLKQKLASKTKGNIVVAKDLDKKTAEKIMGKGYREFSLPAKNKRIYPQGTLAAHILGYYNADADIAAGVEQIAKTHLEDADKSITYEKTGNDKVIYTLKTDPESLTAPIRGKTLQLTIDSAIQHICEKALYKGIQKNKATKGTAIVLDPKTGEILAFALYPTYDPNEYKKYSYIAKKNWAITDVYEPGSTFKSLTLGSALANGKITKYSKINDTGKLKIGRYTVFNYDYKKTPNPGLIDMTYLLQHSSNVGAARVGLLMSDREFYDVLTGFNIGRKTGIDLPGESAGILPEPKWNSTRHATIGYGYGVSVTAIQMASALGAVANNGIWITPHVIKYSTEEAEGKIAQRRVMEEQQAKDLTDLLVSSTDKGSSLAKMEHYKVASKTGTSRRVAEHGKGYTNKLNTSMIGFLPASNPKVVIYVVIEAQDAFGVFGSTVAGPVFKDISTELVKIMNMTPDKI